MAVVIGFAGGTGVHQRHGQDRPRHHPQVDHDMTAHRDEVALWLSQISREERAASLVLRGYRPARAAAASDVFEQVVQTTLAGRMAEPLPGMQRPKA